MAYTENYRVTNARKVNSSKYPDGWLYILKICNHDIYKIGVSQNPKRRIRDIKSHLPFESKVLFLGNFVDVYELEKCIHELFHENKLRNEWFNSYKEDIDDLIRSLKYAYLKENNLLIDG